MAVDTRDKRASVLGLGLASLVVLPSPGTLDQGDRQQTACCYRGVLARALQIPILALTVLGRRVLGLAVDGSRTHGLTVLGLRSLAEDVDALPLE